MITASNRSSDVFATHPANHAVLPTSRINTIDDLFTNLVHRGTIDKLGMPLISILPPELPSESLSRLREALYQPYNLYPINQEKVTLPLNTCLGKITVDRLLNPFRSVDCYITGSKALYILGVEYLELVFKSLNITFTEELKHTISSLLIPTDFKITIDCTYNPRFFSEGRLLLTKRIAEHLEPVYLASEMDLSNAESVFHPIPSYKNVFSTCIGGHNECLGVSFSHGMLAGLQTITQDSVALSTHGNKVLTSTGDILRVIFDKLFHFIRVDGHRINSSMWTQVLALNYQQHFNVDPFLPEKLFDCVLAEYTHEQPVEKYLFSWLFCASHHYLPGKHNALIHLTLQASYTLAKKLDHQDFIKLWNEVRQSNPPDSTFDPIQNVAEAFAVNNLNPLFFFHYLYLNNVEWVKYVVNDFTEEKLLFYCRYPQVFINVAPLYPQAITDPYELVFQRILISPSWLSLWKELKQHIPEEDQASYQIRLPYTPVSLSSLFENRPAQFEIIEKDLVQNLPVEEEPVPESEEKDLVQNSPVEEEPVPESEEKEFFIFDMTGEEKNFQTRFDIYTETCSTEDQIRKALEFAKSKAMHLSSHDSYCHLILRGFSVFEEKMPRADYEIDFTKISEPLQRLELLNKFNILNIPYEKFNLCSTLINLPQTPKTNATLLNQVIYFESVQLSEVALASWLNRLVKNKLPEEAANWLMPIICCPTLAFLNSADLMRDFICYALKHYKMFDIDVQALQVRLNLNTPEDDAEFFSFGMTFRSDYQYLITLATRLNHIKYWKTLFKARNMEGIFKLDLDTLSDEVRVGLFRLSLEMDFPSSAEVEVRINHVIRLLGSVKKEAIQKELNIEFIRWLIASGQRVAIVYAIKQVIQLKESLKKGASVLTDLATGIIKLPETAHAELIPYVNDLLDLPFLFRYKLWLAMAFNLTGKIEGYVTIFRSLSPKEKMEVGHLMITPVSRALMNTSYITDSLFLKEVGDKEYSIFHTKVMMNTLDLHASVLDYLSNEEMGMLADLMTSRLLFLDITDRSVENLCLTKVIEIIIYLIRRDWKPALLLKLIENTVDNTSVNSERYLTAKGENWIPLVPYILVENDIRIENTGLQTQSRSEQLFIFTRDGKFKISLLMNLIQQLYPKNSQIELVSLIGLGILKSIYENKNLYNTAFFQCLGDYINFMKSIKDFNTQKVHFYNCKALLTEIMEKATGKSITTSVVNKKESAKLVGELLPFFIMIDKESSKYDKE